MNNLLQALMQGSFGSSSGAGQFGGSSGSVGALTDALAAYKQSAAAGDQFLNNQGIPTPQANGQQSGSTTAQQSPVDRIKAAFDQLKDMHKGPTQTPQNMSLLGQFGPPAPTSPMTANAQAPASAAPPANSNPYSNVPPDYGQAKNIPIGGSNGYLMPAFGGSDPSQSQTQSNPILELLKKFGSGSSAYGAPDPSANTFG